MLSALLLKVAQLQELLRPDPLSFADQHLILLDLDEDRFHRLHRRFLAAFGFAKIKTEVGTEQLATKQEGGFDHIRISTGRLRGALVLEVLLGISQIEEIPGRRDHGFPLALDIADDKTLVLNLNTTWPIGQDSSLQDPLQPLVRQVLNTPAEPFLYEPAVDGIRYVKTQGLSKNALLLDGELHRSRQVRTVVGLMKPLIGSATTKLFDAPNRCVSGCVGGKSI